MVTAIRSVQLRLHHKYSPRLRGAARGRLVCGICELRRREKARGSAPFLLSDEGLVLVDRLAQQEARVLSDDAWWLMAKCAFLRRCREAGIERAHEEMLRKDEAVAAYMSAQTLESSRHLVEEYPVLQTDLAMAHVDAWASGGGRDHPEQAAFLHGQALFLRRCRQIGVAAAYAERRRKSEAAGNSDK